MQYYYINAIDASKPKMEMGVQNLFQSCNRTPMRADKRAQGKREITSQPGSCTIQEELQPFSGLGNHLHPDISQCHQDYGF